MLTFVSNLEGRHVDGTSIWKDDISFDDFFAPALATGDLQNDYQYKINFKEASSSQA